MILKLKALVSGLVTWVPGFVAMRATGGTDSARYCYSAWLRHFVLSSPARHVAGAPRTVAELGPGDSLGIGLAALLCGVEKYYALDVVQYTDLSSNLAILDELVALFARREPIPGDDEFPDMKPRLTDYSFPHHLLPEPMLRAALQPDRIESIRASLRNPGPESRIAYHAPWTDPSLIQPGSVDMIFSQAVLEHVTDMSGVYEAMHQWLTPGGAMSHQIDYRCHGKADTWNGHWTYSDTAWKVVVGRRPYLLNREPHSAHRKQLREAGFSIVDERLDRSESHLTRRQLAPRFQALSDDDLTTSGAFVLATPAVQPH